MTHSEIEQLVLELIQARKDKDWIRVYAIGWQLVDMGVILENTPQGTIWRMKPVEPDCRSNLGPPPLAVNINERVGSKEKMGG